MIELNHTLDRLAAFEPSEFPVLSLYLNTQPDERGRDHFSPFVRKELKARAKEYPLRSPQRESFDRDAARIGHYLEHELQRSANGLALFACAGSNEFFEAVQTAAPIDAHRLYVDWHPHLFPLARLEDQYRPYGVLLADTNTARVFVFGLGQRLDERDVQSPKLPRPSGGGWSQARLQRHVENYHLHHAKEVAEALDRVVREDGVERIVLAGDEVILPLLRGQLPPHLANRVVEVVHLDVDTPERKVQEVTLEAVRRHDARMDAERVRQLLDEHRAGGLAVVGRKQTMAALVNGQVDELLVTASAEERTHDDRSGTSAGATVEIGAEGIDIEALISQAVRTGAHIAFIEDPSLLATTSGVGATLRYRL